MSQRHHYCFMPILFVLIWSTGFIVAKFGLPFAPPLTFLLLRFLSVLLVLLPVIGMWRLSWPRRPIHLVVAGVLLQAGYLAGVWCAIQQGIPAGLSALIVGLQPILTAIAAPAVGEAVRRRQWLGFIMGLLGVAIVVADKVHLGGITAASIGLCLFALMSITLGTLYQKKYCPSFDLFTGTAIQYAASALVMLPLAIGLEGLDWHFANVHWTPQFLLALAWAVLALSIGAIFLLFTLIRKNAATHVTSLMYLTPPTTAVLAWLIFDEALSGRAIFGMILAVLGVAFVVRKPALMPLQNVAK
ncbi:DMT family transporter [Ampullimonas aquatilis]|uniref:DMT family transporter n=1 Tax=Ampullimonas aquatilis TaxID=1341549 RepID=UPI003C784C73